MDFFGAQESLGSILDDIFGRRTLLFPALTIYFLCWDTIGGGGVVGERWEKAKMTPSPNDEIYISFLYLLLGFCSPWSFF
jgi:hypothetical protein